jgi:L-rhamnose mutarotase
MTSASTPPAPGRTGDVSVSGVRYGSVIGIRPEMAEQYEELHRNVPRAVLQTIADCNIVNYSIFRYQELLFSYFEYVGDDYEADMQKMAEDPATQKWWELCKPMQRQTPDSVEGTWWTPIPEVFHVD